ncbi:hypothetical protein M5E06_29575 [Azospirillum sp. A1-3]|uniref:hypothetical protein n=1 Tax=Azospirillum sp. A1-3 TaxID=185874 RepID=UPI002076F338|nr:hypothetical protein [Azospirillum sp. A1-3]MCM8738281.1 hypothetical protein [Azospirillum sp. A1-3]
MLSAIAGRVHAARASFGGTGTVYAYGELPIELLTSGRHRLVYTIELTIRQIPR